MKATSLIDEFLPEHDFRAAYQPVIHAPATLVYQHLLSFDLYASWIVRLLVSLRYGRRTPRMRVPGDLRRRFQCSGFMILAEAPGEELVVGVAGRFWRPDGGRRLDLSIHDFAGFSCPGEAKIAFNFRVRPGPLHASVLSTETRIQCFGRAAWWKFCLYWAVVRPFSGLIRKAILRQVKADAESASMRLVENNRACGTGCSGD